MPVPELMTWVPSRKRWTRMHRGKRFWVSCKALGVPETKAESVQAANAWWTAKQAEIDSAHTPAPRTPLPLEDVATASLASQGYDLLAIARIIERDWITDRLRRLNLAPEVRAAVEAIFDEAGATNEPEPEFIAQIVQSEVAQLLTSTVTKGDPLPESIAAQLPPARVNQLQDAVKAIRGESATPTDRTIKAQADAWLTVQEKQVDAGQVTAARVNNVRMALAHFTRWLGETADVAGIDAAKLQGFYEYCLTQVGARRRDKRAGWSLPFAKEVFAVARAWLKWLTEQGTIDPPRNLASRFRFGSTAKKIPTWTVDEVQHVIGEAPGKLKLALLLMCNCGMTQIDVSDLLNDEVDWRRGTITRRRSKTKHNENVPVVTYRLWPLTRQLLREYRSGADRVLLTESGKPYVRSEMVNGKLVKADGFTSNYAHLKRRLEFTKSMKLLRKTSASMLESHAVYGRLVPHFLGHSPRGVAAKHYAAPSQELFDKAVLWLGKQLGFVK